ncbi:MAG: PilC/PilY family type IV pilus protein, partial [Cellvibrionaceae bacterium]
MKDTIQSRAFVASVGFVFGLATSVCAAAPLNLSSVPVIASPGVAPNIMILFDTSGSMQHVAPSGAYDKNDSTWAVCNNKELPPGTTVSLYINSNDNPVIYAGDYYYWGDDNVLVGLNGDREKRCFRPDGDYPASLVSDLTGAGAPAVYSGHYLNYYFGSVQDGTWTGNKHPGQSSRLAVGQSVINDFIDAREDDSIKLGLARFDAGGSNGADIVSGVTLLDSAKKTAIKNTINNLTATGFTPLAESLYHIGRYFVGESGTQYNGDLELHPNDPDRTAADDVDDDLVFASSPTYAPGVSSASPIEESCQKNFIVAMTDGKPTEDRNISSYLQDYDGDCTGSPDPACIATPHYDMKSQTLLDGITASGYSYDTGSGGASDFMDDVALALFDIDLRPDIDTPDGEYSLNNIQTYMIGFADRGIQTDQLFKDTAIHGGTGTPYFPENEDELATALNTVINNALSQTGSAASVAFNAGQLSENSVLYLARFRTATWNGELEARRISETGVITETPVWRAQDKLDAQTVADRRIFTYNKDTGEGAPFAWDQLSLQQKNDLRQGVDTNGDGADDDDAQMLLNYLRGDRSNELLTGIDLTKYRQRQSRLGDIVNSTPVYVGAAELGWPDYAQNNLFGEADIVEEGEDTIGRSYSDFKLAVADRQPVVYVGANDGMLHGFNANATTGAGAEGAELFAYVPGAIASDATDEGMHYLADLDYDHSFYVDLTPTVSDVYIDSGDGDGDEWTTILVGGLRAGGRGVYALDVTDPSLFTDPAANADDIVLWEFTSDDDADLGYTYSQPTIAMMANGKWAAIFGNGYNSDNHRAKLFIVFIEEGVDGTWNNGDVIKIDTGVGDSTNANGLSTPTVIDSNGDGAVDRIYAGDLQGNMWAFNVSSSANTNQWGVALSGSPLLTARNASNQIQPITTRPRIGKFRIADTVNNNRPNVMVMFGTGRWLQSTDAENYQDVMSYYAVRDSGDGGLVRSDLEVRELVTSGGMREVSGDAIDWSTQYGWYIDLVRRTTTGGVGTAQGE